MTILPITNTPITRGRIAYSNLLESEDATVTCDDGVEVGYEFENAFDWKPFTFWKPGTDGDHYITAVFGSPQAVNYFAFYATDISTNGGTISLEYSTDGGSTWEEAYSAAPSTTTPVYASFDSISAARWRVKVDSTPASVLGIVAFGTDFKLERGDWVGFTPPNLGRDTTLSTTVSDNGTFLGRSVIRNEWKSGLNLEWLTPTWVRETWLPFMIHAETKPFFFLWSPINFPLEAAFCWANSKGDIGSPEYTNTTYMAAKIRFSARIE